MEDCSYEFELESRGPEGSKVYSFISADGVIPKKDFRDSELLIGDEVRPEKDDDVLVVQSGYGFLGVNVGDKVDNGRVLAADTSDRAKQLTGLNLGRNSIDTAEAFKTSFYSDLDRSFDKIVYAPKSYEPVDLVKNRIRNIIDLLKDRGELFVAGSKTDGINRYKNYMKKGSGTLEKVAQKGSQRLYRYTHSGDQLPEKPGIEHSFEANIDEVNLKFKTCEGLFSFKSLDKGTEILLENLDIPEESKALDLGCGYGAIGIFLSKKLDCSVHLTDDNALATYYAEQNLELNNVEDYEINNRDCLDGFKDKKFDVIVSNPPTHQGKGITDEMFKNSHKCLKKNGSLYLVYNQNMNFEKQLSNKFSKTKVLTEKDNFKY